MNQFWIKILSVPILAIALVSCQKDAITGIDATATPATIASAATSSLTATVKGTGMFIPAVDWSIVSGGGSLSSSTGPSVTYTAPSVTVSTAVQVKAASQGDSSVSKTVMVTVQPAAATPKPTINAFSATPSSLTAAGQVTLIWDVSDATSLSVDSGVGAVTGTSKVVSVASSTAFTLTATNANGSSTSTVTVTVASLPAPPTVVSVSPADGSTGVTADAKIIVTFSQPMDQAATQAAYQSADLPSTGVTFDWNAAATEMTVKPNAPLIYATGSDPNAVVAKAYAFRLTSTAKDKTGNALVEVNSSFKTLRSITFTLSPDPRGVGVWASTGGQVLQGLNNFLVGDFSGNVGIRTFLSFNLPDVPASSSSNLQSAKLSLYKSDVVGYPFQAFNPNPCIPVPGPFICNIKRVPVNLDLVSFPLELTFNSYYTPTLMALTIDSYRILSNTTRVQADVLAAVRYNLDRQQPRSQYRLSFPIPTDNNNQDDTVDYLSPLLTLEYLIP